MAKYNDVHVKLVGEDGNAFAILGIVTRAMRKANLPKEEIDQFRSEAMSGDYDNLLCVVMDWVNTDDEEDNYETKYEYQL
jgi:hypothetical protein